MKTLALTRATLRGTTWLSTDGLRELARRDRLWVLPLAGLGILAGLGWMLFMITTIYRSLLSAGQLLGHPEMVIFYGLFSGWLFIFVIGVPLVLSVLYYSSDLRLLLTLPVSPVRIVCAKGFLLYCYCLPVNLALFVPALWLYIGATGWSAAAVVSGVAGIFLLPILPLSLSTLFVLLLTKLVNLSRFRVALEVAGMTLAIVLLIGFQVVVSRAGISSAMQGGMTTDVSGFTGMYATIEKALPPAAWAARGFVPGAGPVPLLLALLTAAVLCAAALLLAPLNFLHDVIERPERARAGRSRGARAAAQAARLAEGGAAVTASPRPRSVVRTLMGREWSLLASNSTFIFEAFGELIILPLLLGIYGLVIPKEYISMALGFIAGMPVLGIGLTAVLALMTSLTTVSSTSISREGPRMALSLTVPVPGRVQVKAKLRFHLAFFGSAYILDLGIVWVLFRFPLESLLYMVPVGMALQVVSFCIGIYFDLKRPLLNWTHPQQAMKNNLNALSGMGITMAVEAALFAPAIILTLRGANPFLMGGGVALVAVILAAVLLPRLLAFADRQYGGGLEMGG